MEARGEVAVRGSIVDVYPSTDDHPVRIDLWGDEVDRLSAFSVADQRSTARRRRGVDLPDPRAAAHRRRARARRGAASRAQPWGREQWERLAEGQLFDGMESWLPWLTDREHLLPDLLPDDALVLLVEPKRMRDRAQELLDEEAALASHARGHVGRRRRARPPAPVARRSTGCSRTPSAGAVSVLSTPDGPDTPRVAATAFDPVVGDADALARRLRALAGEGYRVVLAAEGTGSAQRLRDVLAGEGVDAGRASLRPARCGWWSRRSTAASCCRARSSRSSPRPTSPAAGACTAARARRASRAPTTTTRSSRATTSCTTSTASAATWR